MKSVLLDLKESQNIEVVENTQFVLNLGEADLTKSYEINLLIKKEGVEAELLGLYKIGEGSDLKIITSANHMVPHTKCTTIVRGVLLNKGKSEYIGKIIINKPAQQTSSYLDDSVLVIGEDTHNNSQPILEIEADDVKASHGATTGRVDASQVYYLKSRGFTEEEAKELIVEGFLQATVNRIIDSDIRSKVSSFLGIEEL